MSSNEDSDRLRRRLTWLTAMGMAGPTPQGHVGPRCLPCGFELRARQPPGFLGDPGAAASLLPAFCSGSPSGPGKALCTMYWFFTGLVPSFFPTIMMQCPIFTLADSLQD